MNDHALLQDTRDRVIKLEVQVSEIHESVVDKKISLKFWESQFVQMFAGSGLISISTVVIALKIIGVIK